MFIYAFGEGDFIYRILQAIVNIMGQGSFQTLIRISVLLGVFILMWQLVFTFNIAQVGLGMLKHYMYIMIVWTVLFVPKASVTVVDLVNPSNSYPPLPGVPYGVAIFGNVFSNIERGIAQLFENSLYTAGDPWAYTTNGYAFPLIELDTLRSATTQDPYVKTTLASYLTDCFFLEVLMGGVNLNTAITVNDLWASMGPTANTAALATKVFSDTNPNGLMTSCQASYNTMNAALPASLNTALNAMAGALGRTPVQLQNSLGPDINRLLGTGAMTTQQVLQQAIVTNMLSASLQSAAVQNGLSGEALGYATAIAQQQQRSTWAVGGELSKKYMPVIRQVMLALLYGAFPIMFVLMFAPWGMTYLKLYATLFIWLCLWAPLYTILNFITSLRAMTVLTPAQGFYSLGAQPYIYESTYDLVAMAGYLSWSVPMLAFAIAKGSEYALTNVIGGLTSGAQGTASSAGSQISGPDVASKMGQASAHFRAANALGEGYYSGAVANAFQQHANNAAYAQRMDLTDMMQMGQIKASQNASDLPVYKSLHNQTGQSYDQISQSSDMGKHARQLALGNAIQNQVGKYMDAIETGTGKMIGDAQAFKSLASQMEKSPQELQQWMADVNYNKMVGNTQAVQSALKEANDHGVTSQDFYKAVGQYNEGSMLQTVKSLGWSDQQVKEFRAAQADLSVGQMEGILNAMGPEAVRDFAATKSFMDTLRTQGAIESFKRGDVSAEGLVTAGAVALQADAGNALAQQKLADFNKMSVASQQEYIKTGQLANDLATVNMLGKWSQALTGDNSLANLVQTAEMKNGTATFGLTQPAADKLNQAMDKLGIKHPQFKEGDMVSMSQNPETGQIKTAIGQSGGKSTSYDLNEVTKGENRQNLDVKQNIYNHEDQYISGNKISAGTKFDGQSAAPLQMALTGDKMLTKLASNPNITENQREAQITALSASLGSATAMFMTRQGYSADYSSGEAHVKGGMGPEGGLIITANAGGSLQVGGERRDQKTADLLTQAYNSIAHGAVKEAQQKGLSADESNKLMTQRLQDYATAIRDQINSIESRHYGASAGLAAGYDMYQGAKEKVGEMKDKVGEMIRGGGEGPKSNRGAGGRN